MTSTTGPVACMQCGYKWITVCPPKSERVRCPRCGVQNWTLLWKPDDRTPELSVN
jgi:hypothetical protein